MTTNDIHGIEQGWSVKTSDGESIGSVEETTIRYIRVKSGLVNADHHYLPAATLAHVRPEMKEIGVGLTKEEFDAGDWSQEPTEAPRVEGAPLNARPDDDPRADPMAAVPRDPERPASL